MHLIKLSHHNMKMTFWIDSMQLTAFTFANQKEDAMMLSDEDVKYARMMLKDDKDLHDFVIELVEPPMASIIEDMLWI